MEDRVNELERLVGEAREAYYNLAPKVSDEIYDGWIEELASLKPGSKELAEVGAKPPATSVWEKVKHEIPMGSLNKVKKREDLQAWASKTGAGTFAITHKMDGSSMELVYKGGKLVRCVTRGDGLIGEDVTENVRLAQGVREDIGVDADVTVRGEIVMYRDVFESKYAGQYANPRNTAAGKVRDKKGGGEACKDLTFVAYWMMTGDPIDMPRTMWGVFMWLEGRFIIPKASIPVHDPERGADAMRALDAFYEETRLHRSEIPYDIDGLVVSVNDLQLLEELGDLNMRPRGQVAWKFEHPTGETRVLDVRWQVGTTGRVVPVASVEPVSIGGVTITSVSLHNLGMFRSLKLRKGSKVLVSRRNEVIPYVERNLDEDVNPAEMERVG